MFLGFTPGALAETSALLCLLAFIFLTIRKTIDWRIPTIYVGSVFVLTYIIGAINGYAGTLNYALFGVLNGGLMFGAVFMATEPVTSPRNPNGVILYSFGLGALTVLFRFASSMPEGVATSILIMNMFTAALERFSAKLRVEPNKRKVVVSYALIGLLFAGIGTLAVVKNMPKHIEFVETEQDFSTFNFKYKFLIGGEEVVVEADKDGNLLSDVDEGVRAEIEALVSENQPEEFIASKEGNSITVQTKAYETNPPLLTKVTYDPETLEITAFEADTSSETYESPYNEKWNKEGNDVHPDEALPNQILENQDDLDKVEAVTGATITSNSLIRAARIALDYLAYLGGKNE